MPEMITALSQQIQGDHDLLIRIDEKLSGMAADFAIERSATLARAVKQDSDMKEMKKDIDSLRQTRAQFYAVAAAISFIISLLIKVFWPLNHTP